MDQLHLSLLLDFFSIDAKIAELKVKINEIRSQIENLNLKKQTVYISDHLSPHELSFAGF
mgnify:CR=1 FL=1